MVGGGIGRGQGQTVWSFCSRDTHLGAASMSEQDLPVLRLHASRPEAVCCDSVLWYNIEMGREESGSSFTAGPCGSMLLNPKHVA